MRKYIISLFFIFTVISFHLHAQGARVQCGDIVEDEFTANGQVNNYHLVLEPGSQVGVRVERFGDFLQTGLYLYAPSGNVVAGQLSITGRPGFATYDHPSVETDILGERGVYTLQIHNGRDGGAGIYTLHIGCTLRDGRVINPGDNVSVPETETPSTPAFTGYGFPGLAPVGFENIAQLPLTVGTPMTGAITPTGSEMFGYTFDGTENERITLDFARISGNVNLGLVLLHGENTIVYQASLITSETMSTTLTLPLSGAYTIGVFRIDLFPPDAPQASAFQVQVNPS